MQPAVVLGVFASTAATDAVYVLFNAAVVRCPGKALQASGKTYTAAEPASRTKTAVMSKRRSFSCIY